MIPLADRRRFADLLALARAQNWRVEMLSRQAVRCTYTTGTPSIIVSAARPYVSGRMELMRVLGVGSMRV